MIISENNQQKLLHQLQLVNQLHQAVEQCEGIPTSATLVALVEQYNEKYKACCQKMDWELPPILTGETTSGTPTTSTPQEDIDCSSFVTAVLQWRADMFKFFRNKQTTHAEVKINVQQFREELTISQSNLPIVQALYQEWQDLLKGMEAELTGKELFEQLMNHSGATWVMTANQQGLEAHYKKNRKAYKKREDNTESFQKSVMPKEQYFLDALKASTSEEDPNSPENVEDLAQKVEKWQEKYEYWLDKTLEKLSEIDTTEIGQVINKNSLTSSRNNKMRAPSYAQNFWESTGSAIEQAILAEEGEVSYEKASEIAIELLEQKYQEYVQEDFFKAAVESNSPSLPLGLQDWLKASIELNEIQYKVFLSQWQDWCRASSNVVALCENKMKGKTYTIDPKKLEKEMTIAFTYTVNGTSPGVDIWKQLQGSMPQKKVNFDQLLTAWQNGISLLLEEEFAKNLWKEHLTAGQVDKNIEAAIAQFFAKAPSQEKLVNALWDARYQAPKEQQPILQQQTQADVIQANINIDWNDVPVLMGEAGAQMAEETGLTTIAAKVAEAVGGMGEVDSSRGIQNLVLRLAEDLQLIVNIPMKIVPHSTTGQPIVIPSSLAIDSVSFTGRTDEYYQTDIQRLYLNTEEPVSTGAQQYEQRLMIALEVTDSPVTVGMSAGAIIADASVEVGKNPRKYSIKIGLLIQSTYDPTTNNYQVQFSRENLLLDNFGGIVRGMTVPDANTLDLEVFKE